MKYIAAVMLLFAAPAYAALTEEQAVEKARAALEQGHWTSLAPECVSYQPVEPKWTFTVREEHNDACGGDPLLAPRLFDIRVDPRTGQASKMDE